jgi:serine/threonine-protein kinase
MPLSPGARVGVYEIGDLIGAGGMGDVYRARDHKLRRDVALKVISTVVANDPDRLMRFRREAQVLASLNHPNIAQIYGFEDDDAGPALVLELVEGPTLADRIADGPIPVAEALAIARQIADALIVAHELGIVHRDLKPANIKLKDRTTTTGESAGAVKVLDFGLAKALTRDRGTTTTAMNSPTMTASGTESGIILGTAAYMSPEQARGKPVDRRADVWAFGVVLYEMLTGRRAFDGREVSDVFASVLRDSPSLDALPADVPSPVRRLLRRALEKDPARRLDSMTAARLDLDDAAGPAAEMPRDPFPRRWWAIPATALLAALIAGATVWVLRAPPPSGVLRLSLTPAPDQPIGIENTHADVAITPDGRRVVYLTGAGQSQTLVVRSLDQPHGLVLNQLGDYARGPFVDSTGRWIAYQAGPPNGRGSELRRVPTDGGAFMPICALDADMRGGSWGADGTIVFATAPINTGLLRVAAAGGKFEVLTTPKSDEGESDHLWPQHLPDGRHVLFSISHPDGTSDAAVLSLATKTWRVIVKDAIAPRYLSSGYLVYGTANGMRAVRFDPRSLALTRDPIDVQSNVLMKESGAGDFAISATGTMVYMPGEAQDRRRTLGWRDAAGRETLLNVTAQDYQTLRISPQGDRVAAVVGRANQSTIWLIDLRNESTIRLTPPRAAATSPVWHPDGSAIVFFGVNPDAPADSRGLYRLSVSGTGRPERLLAAPADTTFHPTAWTPDGNALLLTEFVGRGNSDIKRWTIGPPGEVTPVIATAAPEVWASISPDGKWIAYGQNETGMEVYVRPYPNVDALPIPASNGAGNLPAWSRDGRQVYFASGSDLYVVDVERTSPMSFGKRRLFMSIREQATLAQRVALPPIDGRVLMPMRAAKSSAPPTEYRVIVNWTEELQARIR